MSKRKLKLHFRIPAYMTPRNEWRKLIHADALEAAQAAGVTYSKDDKLAVDLVLYMAGREIGFHDVDNRLKDVLDALQGRMGGSKAIRQHARIIWNDSQVFKVTVTKSLPPPQSHGLGHVTVKRFKIRPPK